jgi:hypothetical protein
MTEHEHFSVVLCWPTGKSRLSQLSRATAWKAAVQFPAEVRNFSLLHSIQTGSRPIQLPIQWAQKPPPPGSKIAGT